MKCTRPVRLVILTTSLRPQGTGFLCQMLAHYSPGSRCPCVPYLPTASAPPSGAACPLTAGLCPAQSHRDRESLEGTLRRRLLVELSERLRPPQHVNVSPEN